MWDFFKLDLLHCCLAVDESKWVLNIEALNKDVWHPSAAIGAAEWIICPSMLSLKFPLEAVNIRNRLQQGRVCAQRRLLQPSTGGNYSLSITSSGGLLVLAHKLQAPQEQGQYSPLKKKLCSECSSWRMTAESRALIGAEAKQNFQVSQYLAVLPQWDWCADILKRICSPSLLCGTFVYNMSQLVRYVRLPSPLFTLLCLQILNSLNLTWWQS